MPVCQAVIQYTVSVCLPVQHIVLLHLHCTCILYSSRCYETLCFNVQYHGYANTAYPLQRARWHTVCRSNPCNAKVLCKQPQCLCITTRSCPNHYSMHIQEQELCSLSPNTFPTEVWCMVTLSYVPIFAISVVNAFASLHKPVTFNYMKRPSQIKKKLHWSLDNYKHVLRQTDKTYRRAGTRWRSDGRTEKQTDEPTDTAIFLATAWKPMTTCGKAYCFWACTGSRGTGSFN